MILSDKTIENLVKEKELIVDPLDPVCIQPASIDCRLGTDFLEVDSNSAVLSLDSEVKYRKFSGDRVIIRPHSFLLATTVEWIKLPSHITAFVEGRSSIGRMGLFIQNAGWVDAGFEGRITLELYNANALPIELIAGRRICQLVFCKMDKPAHAPYRGKYFGQKTTVGSHIFQDVDSLNNANVTL